MHKIRTLIEQFASFEGSLFCYSLSFSFLLALAPALTIFVMLFVIFYLDPQIIIEFGTKFLPADYITPYVDFILSKEVSGLVPLITTLAISMWLASRSIYSFLLVSAQHEEITYPKWSIRIKSLIVSLVLCGYVIASIYALILLGTWLPYLMPAGVCAILLIAFILFYRTISFEKKELSYGAVGGLFATISISGVGYLFFYIVNRFTSYSLVYGPLASLVVLLLSIYVISSIIYFGYLLNVVFEDKTEHPRMKAAGLFDFCTSVHEGVQGFLENKFMKK